MNPIISIIVPVYNVEMYLNRCVDSILAQSYENLELILIDDGSHDKSGEICDQYASKDHRVKVIHQINGGVSAARNKGLSVVSGEWICFVDSDDYLDITYLEDFHISKKVSQMYIQGYKKIFSDRRVDRIGFEKYSGSTYADLLSYIELYNIVNSPCFKLYNINIIRDNDLNFDLKTSYGEDHLFTLTYLLKIKKVEYSLAYGYNYFISTEEGSLSQRNVNYKQSCYYTNKAVYYHQQILDIIKSEQLSYTYKKIHIQNIIRTFKFICKGKQGLKAFQESRQILFYKSYETDNISSILNFKQKFLLLFMKKINSYLAYYLLRLLF